MRVPGFIDVELLSSGPGAFTAQTNGVNASVAGSFAPGTRIRLELRFDVTADGGSGQLNVGFYNDNNAIATLGLMPKPPLTMPWDMHFGLGSSSANGLVSFSYDDVVVYH